MNGRAMTRPTACLPVRISRAIAAAVVELLERDRLLVRGDLEDGVGRRVDDPLPRLLVLLAELLDDLGPGGGLVAEHAAARAVHERVDHLVREPVRIGRERCRRDDAHQLPVTGGRVLPLRPLEQPARDRRRVGLRRAALERLDVAEAERLQVRQVEPADRSGDVPERVRALVTAVGRVRQLPRADGVEHDDARPRHGGYPSPRMDDVLGLLELASTSRVLALSVGVTWVVVKVSPSESAKEQRPRRRREAS